MIIQVVTELECVHSMRISIDTSYLYIQVLLNSCDTLTNNVANFQAGRCNG